MHTAKQLRRGPSLDRLSTTERVEVRKLWRRGLSVWKIASLLKLEPWQVYREILKVEDNT
jgi:IS30 family transposase